MKLSKLKSFKSLDPGKLEEVLRTLGFSSGGVYQLRKDSFLLKLQTDQWESLPPAVPLSKHTKFLDSLTQLGGLQKSSDSPFCDVFPRGFYIYIPDTDLSDEVVFLVLKKVKGVRLRIGEPLGFLEALCHRIEKILSSLLDQDKISLETYNIHINQLELEIRAMVDHELRTPLSSLSGYINLIEIDPSSFKFYLKEVQQSLGGLVNVIDRLSILFQSKSEDRFIVEKIKVDAFLNATVAEFFGFLESYIPGRDKTIQVNCILSATDCMINGSPELLKMVFYELLKNAVSFRSVSKIDICLYERKGLVIIDVIDNGQGVAIGAENLIFTHFYKEPIDKSHKRLLHGLGLGLALAKKIIEQHYGHIIFVRTKGRQGIFRIVVPATHVKS